MKRTIMIAALLLSSAVHAQIYKDVWNDAQKPWRPEEASPAPDIHPFCADTIC